MEYTVKKAVEGSKYWSRRMGSLVTVEEKNIPIIISDGMVKDFLTKKRKKRASTVSK